MLRRRSGVVTKLPIRSPLPLPASYSLQAAKKKEEDELKASRKAKDEAEKAAKKVEEDALKATKKAERDALAAKRAEEDRIKAERKAQRDAERAEVEAARLAKKKERDERERMREEEERRRLEVKGKQAAAFTGFFKKKEEPVARKRAELKTVTSASSLARAACRTHPLTAPSIRRLPLCPQRATLSGRSCRSRTRKASSGRRSTASWTSAGGWRPTTSSLPPNQSRQISRRPRVCAPASRSTKDLAQTDSLVDRPGRSVAVLPRHRPALTDTDPAKVSVAADQVRPAEDVGPRRLCALAGG
jgi:hypothetical protein